MSKAVLISIRPKWCERIASGKKTIEVRKTRPNLEVPFKCYIYETRGSETVGNDNLNCVIGGKGRGAVIGEFVCYGIDRYTMIGNRGGHAHYSHLDERGYPNGINYPAIGLSESELVAYGNGWPLYGWHISELVIYDQPKKMSEFTGLRKTKFGYAPYKIVRPPQSWCYVHEKAERPDSRSAG